MTAVVLRKYLKMGVLIMKTETSSRSPFLIAGCILLAIFALFFPLFFLFPRSSASALSDTVPTSSGDFGVVFSHLNRTYNLGLTQVSNVYSDYYPVVFSNVSSTFFCPFASSMGCDYLFVGSYSSFSTLTSYANSYSSPFVFSSPVVPSSSDNNLYSNVPYFLTGFQSLDIASQPSIPTARLFSNSAQQALLAKGWNSLYFNFGIQIYPDRDSMYYNSSVAVPSQMYGISVPLVTDVTVNWVLSPSVLFRYFSAGVSQLLTYITSFETLGNTSVIQHFGALTSAELPIIYCRLVRGVDTWTPYPLFGEGAGVPEDFIGNSDYLLPLLSYSDIEPYTSNMYLATRCVNATPIGGISPPPSDDPGYDKGYSEGYQAGYNAGYSEGYNKGQTENFVNPVQYLIQPVQAFLDTKLFGSFSFGSFLSVGLFVLIALIFIRMFAGG